jgi:hypothetical protein
MCSPRVDGSLQILLKNIFPTFFNFFNFNALNIIEHYFSQLPIEEINIVHTLDVYQRAKVVTKGENWQDVVREITL